MIKILKQSSRYDNRCEGLSENLKKRLFISKWNVCSAKCLLAICLIMCGVFSPNVIKFIRMIHIRMSTFYISLKLNTKVSLIRLYWTRKPDTLNKHKHNSIGHRRDSLQILKRLNEIIQNKELKGYWYNLKQQHMAEYLTTFGLDATPSPSSVTMNKRTGYTNSRQTWCNGSIVRNGINDLSSNPG